MTPLEKREQADNRRSLPAALPHLIDFASNDYLGLARSDKLKTLIAENIKDIRPLFGSTGSRLLTGNHPYIEHVEAKVAHFHGYEAALLFNCGYMANLGLLSSIAQKNDVVLFDTHIHASMRDGIALSKAQAFPFKHNNLVHLEQRLKKTAAQRKIFICIESIYSTDGAKSPWKDIKALATQYGARLIVDEAHATGLFGEEGKGLTKKNYAHIVTCGKALGAQGAFVLCGQDVKEHLINFAKPFIYTTALPLHVVATIDASYSIFPNMHQERAHVHDLMRTVNISSPIFPVKIPGNTAVKAYAKKLIAHGFDIRALTSPTVRQGNEILRICLHAFNTKKELCTLKSLLPA